MNVTIVSVEKVKRLVYGNREFSFDEWPEDLKKVPVENFIAVVDMVTREGETVEVERKIVSGFPGHFWVEGNAACI